MTKQELQAFVQKAQSRPFAINLTDGRVFVVAHPEFVAFPPKVESFVFFPEDGGLEWIAVNEIVSLSEPPRNNSKTASPPAAA